MNMAGFNPQQLVARGVFASLEEFERAMCELDDARPGPQVIRTSWAAGMSCTVRAHDFNRARMGSGVVGEVGSNVAPFGTAAKPTMTASADVKQSALCVFCAWERAMQPGPRMAPLRINGDVRLWPCARHESSPPKVVSISSAGGNGQHQTPHPGGVGPSVTTMHGSDSPLQDRAAGLLSSTLPNSNPNAGVVAAFPKGRWS
jgi:hypothetical protein